MPQLPTPTTSGDVWGNTLNNFLTTAHDNTTTSGGKIKPEGILPGSTGQVLTTTSTGAVGWQNSTAGTGSIVAAVNFNFLPAVFGSNSMLPMEIYSSLNVSSVGSSWVRYGFTFEPISIVNFTNPLPDANYFVSFNYGLNDSWIMGLESRSSTSLVLRTRLIRYYDLNNSNTVVGGIEYIPAAVSLIVVR